MFPLPSLNVIIIGRLPATLLVKQFRSFKLSSSDLSFESGLDNHTLAQNNNRMRAVAIRMSWY